LRKRSLATKFPSRFAFQVDLVLRSDVHTGRSCSFIRLVVRPNASEFQKYSERFRPTSGLRWPIYRYRAVRPSIVSSRWGPTVIPESESVKVAAAESPTAKNNALLAIAVGAFVGGTVNILWVCIQAGWVIPLYIAAGLLGMRAVHGGAGIWLLGMALHYFISSSWATVYYLASRKLPFLTEYPLICGINFGVWVELFMKLVVLPHSGLHATEPIGISDLVGKVLLFGLPVVYSVSHFAPARAPGQVPSRSLASIPT
jgi:hypothetical protein